MTREEAISRFSALSRDRQIAVLAMFGHEITIDARATYVPGTEGVEDPSKLRRLSEILHRVLCQIRDLTQGHNERYPDDVIVSILWEAAPDHMRVALGKS
jgi:hypothetical protein